MKESIIKIVENLLKPRTIFAIMFYGTYCWLIFQKTTPPDGLTNIVLLMLAFYYGSKKNQK